jgi:hypothetical protein
MTRELNQIEKGNEMSQVEVKLTETIANGWKAEGADKMAWGSDLVDACWKLARKLRVARERITVVEMHSVDWT